MTISRLILLALLASTGLLHGCRELPGLDARTHSSALRDTADTPLGRAITPRTQAHPGASGVIALTDGRDAFAARSLLANAAQRSIDVQYYIWRHDLSGTLLFEALHRAADRGVRVRLLLDDNNTVGLDPILSMLDAHPQIEVRLFNPFMHRRWRALGYLTDFARLNRRMHNKSFTVDNQATIIGGRNVGDEYFDANEAFLFVDVDVLAIGPVVSDVSSDFDRYWASESSYPAARVLPAVEGKDLSALTAEALLVEHEAAAAEYVEALTSSPFMKDLLEGKLAFEWAPTRLISDPPSKGLDDAGDEPLLPQRLSEALGAPSQELHLISPYFVPTAAGVDSFVAMARQNVDISILTNSLEATDVAAVHAGYAKRRQPLLDAGISLFEMKRAPSPQTVRDRGLPGSSASSLHAKVFSVDGARVFIGSFNFDPRSAELNTENGFVIDSSTMANAIADTFDHAIPANAYELALGESGSIQWKEQTRRATLVHDDEPGVGFWERAGVHLLSWLPIEWLL